MELDYQWRPGGPGSQPLFFITDDEGRAFIRVVCNDFSKTKVFNAYTGEELWDTGELQSYLARQYDRYGFHANIVYFFDHGSASRTEYFILDHDTGEILKHSAGSGLPFLTIGNRILFAEGGLYLQSSEKTVTVLQCFN